jgi:C1A family cysteine protease
MNFIEIFLYEALKCGGFPGPGARNLASANPMSEYIHSFDLHVHHEFDQFKNKHGVSYDTEMEHSQRLHLFRQNLRYIDSINRKGLSYTVAVNHMADKSDEELKILRGKLKSSQNQTNNGLPFNMNQYKRKDLPDSFDWRIYGAVAPVKDQGIKKRN